VGKLIGGVREDLDIVYRENARKSTMDVVDAVAGKADKILQSTEVTKLE
jgi:hypothetical protein